MQLQIVQHNFKTQDLDRSTANAILSIVVQQLPRVIMQGNTFNLTNPQFFGLLQLTIRKTQKDGTTQEFVMQYYNNQLAFHQEIPGAQYATAAASINNFHVDSFEPLQDTHREVRFSTAVWNDSSANLGTLYEPLNEANTYPVKSRRKKSMHALTEPGTATTPETSYKFDATQKIN